MRKTQKEKIYIEGIHCTACELFLKDIFHASKKINAVQVNHTDQSADLVVTGKLDTSELKQTLAPYGYTLQNNLNESFAIKLYQAAVPAIILSVIFFFYNEFSFIETINIQIIVLIGAYIFGLFVATTSCMSLPGKLFHRAAKTTSVLESSAIQFLIGRIAAFSLIGALSGYIGKIIIFDLHIESYLLLFIGIILGVMALDMLRLINLSRFIGESFRVKLFYKLEPILLKNPQKNSLFIGALTILLPCGFTQSVQVFSLYLADPFWSGLCMGIFAAATSMQFLNIPFIQSYHRVDYYPIIIRFIHVAILLAGIYYVSIFLHMQGLFKIF